jgi:hypothetical protein
MKGDNKLGRSALKNPCPKLAILDDLHIFEDIKHKNENPNNKNGKDCGPTDPVEICDNRIRLFLAGLHDNLNFDFLTHIGCQVTIKLYSMGAMKEITGKIDAGIDFMKIIEKNQEMTTVLQAHIVKVIWHDIDCRPCGKQQSHDL